MITNAKAIVIFNYLRHLDQINGRRSAKFGVDLRLFCLLALTSNQNTKKSTTKSKGEEESNCLIIPLLCSLVLPNCFIIRNVAFERVTIVNMRIQCQF